MLVEILEISESCIGLFNLKNDEINVDGLIINWRIDLVLNSWREHYFRSLTQERIIS